MIKISVIIPVYYGENYIPGIIGQIESCRECLDVSDQIEVLFVNDAPDAPLGLGWKSKMIDIKIINTDRNVGIHGARLKGLAQSTGEFILFLDQDDKIAPEYFESQLQNIGDHDAVICKALKGNKPLYYDADCFFENLPYKQFVLKEWNLIISPGQVLIRTESIPDAWVHNILKYNGADDWFLWICMYAEECSFSLNEEILYEHIIQESNATNDVMSMLNSEQEMLDVIQDKKILSSDDFKLLLKGYHKKNIIRTRELWNAKKKLDALTKWRKVKDRQILFSNYLLEKKSKRIAIYGCGILGEYLCDELKESIDVKYFIDRNAKNLCKNIPVYTLADDLPEVDSVVITLIDGIKNVGKELEKKDFKNIIILKDWLANACCKD